MPPHCSRSGDHSAHWTFPAPFVAKLPYTEGDRLPHAYQPQLLGSGNATNGFIGGPLVEFDDDWAVHGDFGLQGPSSRPTEETRYPGLDYHEREVEPSLSEGTWSEAQAGRTYTHTTNALPVIDYNITLFNPLGANSVLENDGQWLQNTGMPFVNPPFLMGNAREMSSFRFCDISTNSPYQGLATPSFGTGDVFGGQTEDYLPLASPGAPSSLPVGNIIAST